MHPFRAPKDARIYAIGDIHGRADLLARLLGAIRDDAESWPGRKVIVFLGDYVDRGPNTMETVDIIIHGLPDDFEIVCLLGNHERMMLDFLDGTSNGTTWMLNGGMEALVSYHVAAHASFGGKRGESMRREFANVFPRSHDAFLRGLAISHREGDYFFVHAGVMPGVPLDEQSPQDMIWIRDKFLLSEEDHGCCIVHGHSISLEPEFKPNRIGIDTGAYRTGRLTALVLEGNGYRVMQTN